jgi:hypothetical protein
MSEVVLKRWYEHCKTHLECHSQTRMNMEKIYKDQLRSEETAPSLFRGKIDRWSVEPFVIAHEFLYLICNCEDRLRTIKRYHKPELVSNKGNIHHWEILNKQTGKQQV